MRNVKHQPNIKMKYYYTFTVYYNSSLRINQSLTGFLVPKLYLRVILSLLTIKSRYKHNILIYPFVTIIIINACTSANCGTRIMTIINSLYYFECTDQLIEVNTNKIASFIDIINLK